MTAFPVYVVRPLLRISRVETKDIFRVYLSSTTLVLRNLHPGDVCTLLTPGDVKGLVLVWPAPEKIQDSVIQLSKPLQLLYDIKLGDKVSISHNNESIQDCSNINLYEIPQANSATTLPSLSEDDRLHWAWYLEYTLQKAELICPAVVFENVELKGERRSFKVADVNSSSDLTLYRVQSDIKTSILDIAPVKDGNTSKQLYVSSDGIGGLEKQLKWLNAKLKKYHDKHQTVHSLSDHRPRHGAIMIHGARGTGKSTILRSLTKAGWRKVFQLDTLTIMGRSLTERVKLIREMFDEAHRNQPSLITVDKIELLCSKDIHSHETVAAITACLGEELDGLSGARVLVVAATSLLPDIDGTLRGRFEYEIEIPVPDSRARREILKVLCKPTGDADIQLLEALGERTHGFVGADLEKLIRRAIDKAEEQLESVEESNTGSEVKPEITVQVVEADFIKALLEVRPTAMKEVFLQTPNVRWSDIGGQTEVKKLLLQAIEWPFKNPAVMTSFGVEDDRGLLLYGPPGCSKTLIAKAVATESGLNFLAVKGGELLNMYVGESERAVREIFRKARSVSPSILFFDEIDAIGGSREGNSQHGGVNTLTTLLNELDGIEPLTGVFVLAATNRPEVLDPALIRPGRFDRLVFVGLPDHQARREIIQMRLHKIDVDENVSQEDLAAWTEGYTGAEIVSVCQQAGRDAMEEQITLGTKQYIRTEHFEAALAKTSKRVTEQIIEGYLNWAGKTKSSRCDSSVP